MTKARTNLLTQGDRDLISGIGFPLGPRPDLHHISQSGEVRFTLKGRQFYHLTLQRLGLLHRYPEIKTRADLYRIKQDGLELLASRLGQDAIAALATRQILLQGVEAVTEVLFGTLESFDAASERLLACRAVGENVIPVNFKKKHREQVAV